MANLVLNKQAKHNTTNIDAVNATRIARIDWVDYAKGFCIILVVMMHSTLGVQKAAGDIGWLGYVVEFARPFRMPDFFMISGLFLGLVINRPWLRYFDRKVVHFFYFYVLWVTIQFAFKAPVWFAEGADISDLILKYLTVFVEPFGTLWFIYMLPVFFIVTRLLKSVPWWAMMLGAAVLQILPIHVGHMLIDEFASRYVFFLAGYLFATNIFNMADWIKQNTSLAVIGLAAWAVINGVFVFAGVPDFLSQSLKVTSFADLPIISLGLGALGGLAIITVSTLLSKLSWTGFLKFLGRNSIVIYLAFFLPMAISRTVLLKYASFLDIGTISALVTSAGVICPVILYGLIQYTGFGKFLFERPQWAMLDKHSASKASLNSNDDKNKKPGLLNPAE
ncbi:MAG: acyltransferase family protein [Rhizobiales bacterium]|nr:acyltransferase family protein [Hyphomicrobiales bacterium]